MADAGETGSGQLGNDGGFGNNGLGAEVAIEITPTTALLR